MKKYMRITPDGTRDVLFDECVARRRAEKALSNLYKHLGYNRVITPDIEFFDVFNRESIGVLAESMYKLSDNHGRLLVLRPDNTIPIARLAATRLKDMEMPLRLYYTQNVYHVNADFGGHNNEIAQSGVELIGTGGIKADLEMLSTAINAIDVCGVSNYRIEIGHAGFFRGLCNALEVDEDTRDELILLFEDNNYVAIEKMLEALPDNSITCLLRKLPRMFGGEEILNEAFSLIDIPECRDALLYLKTLYDYLSGLNKSDSIQLDLGLVHRTDYYTGVIFRGFIEGSGVTVLSGGRYDNLINEFGIPLPAIGFGIEIDALTDAVLSVGEPPHERIPDKLIFADTENQVAAMKYIFEQSKNDLYCINSVDGTLDEAIASARRRGITTVEHVGRNGVIKRIEVK